LGFLFIQSRRSREMQYHGCRGFVSVAQEYAGLFNRQMYPRGQDAVDRFNRAGQIHFASIAQFFRFNRPARSHRHARHDRIATRSRARQSLSRELNLRRMIVVVANRQCAGVLIDAIGNVGGLQSLHYCRLVIIGQASKQVALWRLAKHQPDADGGKDDCRQYDQRQCASDRGLLQQRLQRPDRTARTGKITALRQQTARVRCKCLTGRKLLGHLLNLHVHYVLVGGQ